MSEVKSSEQQQVNLQISDLLLATQVIQVSSQRGAIKPEEMEAVGGLYNRLVEFLKASGALVPQDQAQAQANAEQPTPNKENQDA
jgi:hypothetical protein